MAAEQKNSPERERRFFWKRSAPSHLSGFFILQDLAPRRSHWLPVAGLHWASPSAALDKSDYAILLVININTKSHLMQ
jgi:hypothetical protein